MSASAVDDQIETTAAKIVRLRKVDGMTAKAIAGAVRTHVSYVWAVLSKARLAGELPKSLRVARRRRRPPVDEYETPREARSRVSREIMTGKRCPRCWLLLPCDH